MRAITVSSPVSPRAATARSPTPHGGPECFVQLASYSGRLHPLQRADVVLGAARFVEVDDSTRIWGDPIRDRATWAAHDPYHLAGNLTAIPIFLSSCDGASGEFDPPDLQREPLFAEIDRYAAEFPDAVDLTEAVMRESTRAVADRLRQLGAQPVVHLARGTHSRPDGSANSTDLCRCCSPPCDAGG